MAGLVAAALQQLFLVPLILRAELLEVAGHAQPMQAISIERTIYSVLFTCLGACGFALLLGACYTLRGDVSWRGGLLWGLAGFVSFALAPALGLPPELPGAHPGDLAMRQMWWITTAGATAVGLACIAFSRATALKLLGVALIALPHLFGAPQATQGDSDLPTDMAWTFALSSLAVSALMWLILGALTPVLMRRYKAQTG